MRPVGVLWGGQPSNFAANTYFRDEGIRAINARLGFRGNYGRNTDQLWRKRQRQADLGSDLLAGDFQGRGSELEMLFGPAALLESLLGFNHVQEGSTSRQRIIGCPTLQNWKG